ncbi:MAG TPA: DUF1893 domain-containing protein [Dehalococcoidales bacterium]
MYTNSYEEFLSSKDTLRVYQDSRLLFSSSQDRVVPLLEYIDRFATNHRQVVIFDKIMGNAAALLSVKANSQEVFSPLGSQLAIKTLENYNIKYHLTQVVPYIQKASGEDMCPMERLSIGKDPEEFYQAIKEFIKK